jgi:tRNA threonylcarbamoyladenosine biosynthesis protein TsaE
VSAAPGEATAGARRLTRSAAETERLGEALAPGLAEGDLLVLTGPLGAGKTRFVAGLARGMGKSGRVRSPTFTLLHEYGGHLPLLHLDLYRLERAEVEGLGLEESLERGVVVVEWGERLPAHLRAPALTLEFEIVSERERAIVAHASRGRGGELLALWQALPPGGALGT